MDVVFTHGAGLDVHQQTVMACRVTPDATGQQADGLLEVQELGTLTRDLWAWSDWLREAGVPHVAMASTGESWKPVDTLREGDMTVCLVHAAQVQHVPGRQTDRADARWLATRMRHGLLPASVIPPVEPRELRDLTRYRTTLVQERTREVNRGPGVLERANITWASVASDLMGGRGGPSWPPCSRGEPIPPPWPRWPRGAGAARSRWWSRP